MPTLQTTTVLGDVRSLHRYPVKSMLGESPGVLEVDRYGVTGDRALALVDPATGRVATAKQPRWWRRLLQCSATADADGVRVRLPDGRVLPADEVDDALSALLGRRVVMTRQRPPGALVERPDPEAVLEHGLDADIEAAELEIAQGAPGGRFVDHSPVHLITRATLEGIGVDPVRYRPNVVVDAPAGEAFAENGWLGRRLRIGEVELTATIPTPRCSVPTLEHGKLGRERSALGVPAQRNRVDVPGFGVLPCAGVYATVTRPGTVREHDRVELLDDRPAS